MSADQAELRKGYVVRISYRVMTESGQEEVETTVVPNFLAKWMAAELSKRRGVKPHSIALSADLAVRVDQYNAAVTLRDTLQKLDLAGLRVAMVFAQPSEHDTVHPETCLAIMETVQRGLGELREWVDRPLTYMVGRGITTAIPFPASKT